MLVKKESLWLFFSRTASGAGLLLSWQSSCLHLLAGRDILTFIPSCCTSHLLFASTNLGERRILIRLKSFLSASWRHCFLNLAKEKCCAKHELYWIWSWCTQPWKGLWAFAPFYAYPLCLSDFRLSEEEGSFALQCFYQCSIIFEVEIFTLFYGPASSEIGQTILQK